MQDRDDFCPQGAGWEGGSKKEVGESLIRWVYQNLAAIPAEMTSEGEPALIDHYEAGFSLGCDCSATSLFHTLNGVAQGLIISETPDERQQELLPVPGTSSRQSQEIVSFDDLDEMQPLIDLAVHLLNSASKLVVQTKRLLSGSSE